MGGPEIRIELAEGGLARFSWNGPAEAEALLRAVREAADTALRTHGLRRIEIAVPATDVAARRATLRAGFRQEGIQRQAQLVGGHWVDVILYARLAADEVQGPTGFSGVMNSALPR